MSGAQRSAIEARLFEYCPWIHEEFDPFAPPEHPSPASVAEKLREEFDEESIARYVEGVLRERAEQYGRGQVPDSQELRMTQCAMELVADRKGFPVSPGTVRRMVSTYPPAIAALWLKPIIDRVLSRIELLEELLRALRAAVASGDSRALQSALAAVYLYWGRGSGPLTSSEAQEALKELWAELEALEETDDFEVARLVKAVDERISDSGIPRPG